MTINNISGGASSCGDMESAAKSRRANFDALQKALDAGDLDSAKSAFDQIKQSAPKPHHHKGGSNAKNPMQQDMDTLAKALESGDLDGARKAFSTITDNMKAHRSHQPMPAEQSADIDASDDVKSLLGASIDLAA